MKIRMLVRFGAETGKMEKGLTYEVPEEYAWMLIKTGLAEIVAVDEPIMEKPVHITAKEIGKIRTKSGRFMPKAKVK